MPPPQDKRTHAGTGAQGQLQLAIQLDGAKLYVRLPDFYQTPAEFQLEVRVHDDGALHLAEQIARTVSLGARRASILWNERAVARELFWNLMLRLRSFDHSKLSFSDGYGFKVAMQDIKDAVNTLYHSEDVDVVTLEDMLLVCFTDDVKGNIERLQDALRRGDVHGIQELGTRSEAYHDDVIQQTEVVRTWLSRQYVLWALQIETLDASTGHAATQLTHWMERLEDVVTRYATWSDGTSTWQHSTTYGNTIPRQPTTPSAHLASGQFQPSSPVPESANSHPATPYESEESPAAYVHVGTSAFEDLTPRIHDVGENYVAFGASSTVYQGALMDYEDGREVARLVALKVVHIPRDSAVVAFKRLRRELHLWSALDHQNILPILGVSHFPPRNLLALVSPWCEHGSLAAYIASRRDDITISYPLGSVILDLFEQLLDALQYLHGQDSPVVHGDLKGQNIFVDEYGALKLSDFGLSRMSGFIGSVNLESSTVERGTVRFMSREHLLDSAPTIHSDMWASSCVFVEMASGRAPYHEHKSVPAVVLAIIRGDLPTRPTDLTDELWAIITVNWNPLPLRRFRARTMLGRLRTLRREGRAGESVPYDSE
ncbi:kinase-like protein [Exidia glandulosa HHB12029]|uniref:Kinase-like protein n=1 Tax=Exidia glandulosa HHB12029 TaxID=1314781 RepID=A0A165C2I5_EXIGL|nr:kinase-like protein [Exidia glandulosa HHB12029]